MKIVGKIFENLRFIFHVTRVRLPGIRCKIFNVLKISVTICENNRVLKVFFPACRNQIARKNFASVRLFAHFFHAVYRKNAFFSLTAQSSSHLSFSFFSRHLSYLVFNEKLLPIKAPNQRHISTAKPSQVPFQPIEICFCSFVRVSEGVRDWYRMTSEYNDSVRYELVARKCTPKVNRGTAETR